MKRYACVDMSVFIIATLAVLAITFFTLRLLTLCDWDDHD